MPKKSKTAYWLLAGIFITCASAWLGYDWSLRTGLEIASADSDRRLLLFERTLDANIERFRFLPSTIAQSSEVRAALLFPDDETRRLDANSFLSNLNSNSSTDELFVMDLTGETIAASNWWSRRSLVGGQFEVRPYFRESLVNGDAQYYAMGLVTNVAGYFLAERIEGPDGPLGVAVTKVNMGEIEAVWWRSGELIAIVDQNDVVVLSTRPDWRYRPITPLSAQAMAIVSEDLRYGHTQVNFSAVTHGLSEWRGQLTTAINSSDPETNGELLVSELRMPLHGWTLYSFTALQPIVATARVTGIATGLASAGILLAAALLMQRQRLARARLINHRRLEERVAQRTLEWKVAHQRLEEEMAERKAAEQQQRRAEEKLVQASKLASLGQALAGVAHEISQPLAALKNQNSSARLLARQGPPELSDVLNSMNDVIARMAELTGHLRSFARPAAPIAIPNDILHVVENTVRLLAHLALEQRLKIEVRSPNEPIIAIGNPIHIEQVLVNLLTNAADAMENSRTRVATVTISKSGNWANITVADKGPGIAPEITGALFEPFISTKEPGKGLGLGLSISYGLMQDMGGTLEYAPGPVGGAVFTVSLPLANSRTNLTQHRQLAQ